MKWTEVQIKTTSENEDIISDILYRYGATGLTIVDPNDIAELSRTEKDWDFVEPDLINTGFDGIIIKAYYEMEEGLEDTLKIIRDELENPVGKKAYGVMTTAQVDDEDWSDNWKNFFSTIIIDNKIIIKPSWEDYEEKEGDIVIQLDPGMAFGTGSHETTMMCTRALNRYTKEDSTVFDVGCGSGILAIAAAKLGAKEVIAIDLDETCVKVSEENVVDNHVKDIVQVRHGNLLDVVSGKADIIVANIIAEIIVDMVSTLKDYLVSEGIFICSGIIAEKLDMVKNALNNEGFNILNVEENNGWACISSRV